MVNSIPVGEAWVLESGAQLTWCIRRRTVGEGHAVSGRDAGCGLLAWPGCACEVVVRKRVGLLGTVALTLGAWGR